MKQSIVKRNIILIFLLALLLILIFHFKFRIKIQSFSGSSDVQGKSFFGPKTIKQNPNLQSTRICLLLKPQKDSILDEDMIFTGAISNVMSLRMLLNSLINTIFYHEAQTFKYEVWAGVSTTDNTTYFSNEVYRRYVTRKFNSRGIPFKLVELTQEDIIFPDKLVHVVNVLSRKAYDDGCHYFYFVEEMTEFLTKGWTTKFIKSLQSQNNIGVVQPVVEGGTTFLQTSFIHKTHLEIFPYFFPSVYTDWFAEEWLCQIYREFCMKMNGMDTLNTKKVPTVKVYSQTEIIAPELGVFSVYLINQQQVENSRAILLKQITSILPKYKYKVSGDLNTDLMKNVEETLLNKPQKLTNDKTINTPLNPADYLGKTIPFQNNKNNNAKKFTLEERISQLHDMKKEDVLSPHKVTVTKFTPKNYNPTTDNLPTVPP